MFVLSGVAGDCSCVLFFFFKQKTAYDLRISDWSSDVCSSDLRCGPAAGEKARENLAGHPRRRRLSERLGHRRDGRDREGGEAVVGRSEERRVGKECVQYV